MIGRLAGSYEGQTTGGAALIDVGGVGYAVRVTPETLRALEQNPNLPLLTHLSVREDALDLYGFLNEEELRFFELLLMVSGIGPKSALGILSVSSVATLKSAIPAGDITYLTKVSGIGKKTAERIVVELKDKLGGKEGRAVMPLKEETEALEALRALGYGLEESRSALKRLADKGGTTGERLKEALRLLSQ